MPPLEKREDMIGTLKNTGRQRVQTRRPGTFFFLGFFTCYAGCAVLPGFPVTFRLNLVLTGLFLGTWVREGCSG